MNKERQDETQFTTKVGGKTSLDPSYFDLKDKMKLSLPPKLVENLVWIPVISICKIFIPSYTFDALLSRNWPFSPPSRVTSQIITLIDNQS
jgi:hypothetical protein